MTSEGSAHGRFTRAIQQRNLWAAESSLRELGTVSLEDALGYLDLLADQKPEKLERAAVRWHGRLETEATFLSLVESQLALARAGESLRWRAGIGRRAASAVTAGEADARAAYTALTAGAGRGTICGDAGGPSAADERSEPAEARPALPLGATYRQPER